VGVLVNRRVDGSLRAVFGVRVLGVRVHVCVDDAARMFVLVLVLDVFVNVAVARAVVLVRMLVFFHLRDIIHDFVFIVYKLLRTLYTA
jgi:hypothetical protein